ncbi:MAG: hypothetical protein ACXAD7_25495 [Candidatus Kariarchaeaceae archaeon]
MFKLGIDKGVCPNCGHEDRWLTPVDELAVLGWVLEEEDDRVKQHTTVKDCPRYQEACSKRKVNY